MNDLSDTSHYAKILGYSGQVWQKSEVISVDLCLAKTMAWEMRPYARGVKLVWPGSAACTLALDLQGRRQTVSRGTSLARAYTLPGYFKLFGYVWHWLGRRGYSAREDRKCRAIQPQAACSRSGLGKAGSVVADFPRKFRGQVVRWRASNVSLCATSYTHAGELHMRSVTMMLSLGAISCVCLR